MIQLSLSTEVGLRLKQRSEQAGLTPEQYVAALVSQDSLSASTEPQPASCSTKSFLDSRIEEFSRMTPEELKAAEEEFEQLKKNMNETRKLEGRPPAFY